MRQWWMRRAYWEPPRRIRWRDRWQEMRSGWVSFRVLTLDGWQLYVDRPWRWPAVFFGYLFRSLREHHRALKARSA